MQKFLLIASTALACFSLHAENRVAVKARANENYIKARALDKMRKRPGRYEFQRGIATLNEDNQWQVGKTGKQGSGILTSMSRANCFIVLPDENAGVDIGDEIDIQFFDWSLG